MNKIDLNDPEIKKKIVKYLIMTLLVSLSARYTTSLVLPNEEVIILGLIAGIIFAILDMFAPSISLNI
jgi:hypothetical protein